MSNFRNIIVPETLKCLEINDPTVSAILTKFEEILLSCDMTLDDMITTLQSWVFKKNEVSLFFFVLNRKCHVSVYEMIEYFHI